MNNQNEASFLFFNQLSNTIRQILNQETVQDTIVAKEMDEYNNSIQNKLWKELIDLGALSANISIEAGGTELGEEVISLFLEEVGKKCLRTPYLGCLLLADIFQLNYSECNNLNHLIKLSTGEEQADLILGKEFPSNLKINKNNQNALLDGYLGQTQYLSVCKKYIVVLKDKEKIRIIALEKTSPGLLFKKKLYLEELGIVSVYASQVVLTPEHIIANFDLTDSNWILILSKLRIRQSSYLIGLCQGIISKLILYTSNRTQFGKKLLDFQNVAFRTAELFAQVRIMKLRLSYAVELLEKNLLTYSFASETLVLISELALLVVKEAIHFHGAYGMINYSLMPLFYKTASFESTRFGTPLMLWNEISEINYKSIEKKEI